MLNINAKVIENDKEIAQISLRILPREGENLDFNDIGVFKIKKIIYHLHHAGNRLYHSDYISIIVEKRGE